MPGLIVSALSRVASPLTPTLIVTDCPAAREPDVWERLTLPSSPDGTEMDQLTGPPSAVSVNEPLRPAASVISDVDTDSVPALADDEGCALGEEDADGEGDADGAEDDEPPDDEPDAPDAPDALDDDDPDVAVAAPVRPADDAVLDAAVLPLATVTDDPPDVGSDDGVTRAAGRPGRITTDFACPPTPWDAPAAVTFDEGADGTTADSEEADADPVPVAGAWCPVVANPVAVAATAMVPTVATASRGAVSMPSRPASALGKPSSPNDTPRPPTARRQAASGPLSAVIR